MVGARACLSRHDVREWIGPAVVRFAVLGGRRYPLCPADGCLRLLGTDTTYDLNNHAPDAGASGARKTTLAPAFSALVRRAGQAGIAGDRFVIAPSTREDLIDQQSPETRTNRGNGHHAAERQIASHGLGNFYANAGKTRSGEQFDPREVTAAHRTLPFGTQLRATCIATGRSVTVRVNDRGSFIPGRVVTSHILRPKGFG